VNLKLPAKPAVILVADDSEADREIIRRALNQGRLRCELQEVSDGDELLQYLRREARFDDAKRYPEPDLLLLDINMPRVDGKQALRAIRQTLNPTLPVVMLTTSRREQDVIESYALGVNAYISKPVEIDAFLETVRQLENFWLDLVTLPSRAAQD